MACGATSWAIELSQSLPSTSQTSQVMVCIMLAVFVREGRSKLESAGGLTETIGRATYNNRM